MRAVEIDHAENQILQLQLEAREKRCQLQSKAVYGVALAVEQALMAFVDAQLAEAE